MPIKVLHFTQEFRALQTYSVITNSLCINKLWGGVHCVCVCLRGAGGGGWKGCQRPWSAGLMPLEQSGFSALLKVSAATDMYAQ